MRNYFKFYFGSKDPLADEIPWMTYKAIRWLNKNVIEDFKIFEWGSGGSTIFFADRCAELVSVEHDSKWYKKVKGHLIKLNNKCKLTQRLIMPEIRKNLRSSDIVYDGKSYKKYCMNISKYPRSYFDIVVVDGRARNECIAAAKSKVKKGGYLVLDNSEREGYEKGIKLLSRWRRIDFFGKGPFNPYSWQTSVFINT